MGKVEFKCHGKRGRITLIKAVLGSLPVYYMPLFRAPINVINSIKQVRRKFCWGTTRDNKKICWIAWNECSLHKQMGGFGIGPTRAASKTLFLTGIGAPSPINAN